MGVGPVLVVLAVAAGAFAQSISGFGFSLIATPACDLLLGPWHGLRAAAPMAVAVDGLVLARGSHDHDPGVVRRLVGPPPPVEARSGRRRGGQRCGWPRSKRG